MKLYELGGEWKTIEAELEANGGEVTPELAARMEAIEESLSEKIDRYYRLIRNAESAADALKAEAKALTERAKGFESTADGIKAHLLEGLQALGHPVGAANKLLTPDGTHHVYLAENPPSVVVPEGFDVATLPRELTKVSVTMDKSALLKLPREEWPEGVKVERKTSLRIK